MEPKYNVYIVDKDGKAVTCIGKDIREGRVDTRIMTGLSRIDRDNFFVDDVEVGSDKDKKYQADL